MIMVKFCQRPLTSHLPRNQLLSYVSAAAPQDAIQIFALVAETGCGAQTCASALSVEMMMEMMPTQSG